MKKTHVPYLSIIGRQCHNRQLALHFCAILGVGTSVGSGTGTSAGTSARSSAETGNMVRFSL
jgi:hypothetical protein